ncbi:MAG: NTP transferase domain-containing protein, partial [Actinomycetota bacterium]
LPGKVLAEMGGTTMLGFLLDRLAPLPWPVVVATSDLGQDDVVAALAAEHGVQVVRGPEQDVLARYRIAADETGADVIVRLTADCPLLDPALVEEVVMVREAYGSDYASNSVVRCFPDGLDAEAMTADALRTADAEATDAEDREHVTPFIWRRPDRFTVTQVVTEPPRGLERECDAHRTLPLCVSAPTFEAIAHRSGAVLPREFIGRPRGRWRSASRTRRRPGGSR